MKDVHCSRGHMFEMGRKPRFHDLDPGSMGLVLFCHFVLLYLPFLLSLFLPFAPLFYLFVCFFSCFGADFFSCFYSVTSPNAALSVALRDGK